MNIPADVMAILIDAVCIAFSAIMLAVAGIYAYYLFRVQYWLDRYKNKDWRYDGTTPLSCNTSEQ
jgi:hypothetical protein